jgi:hypothetical protein
MRLFLKTSIEALSRSNLPSAAFFILFTINLIEIQSSLAALMALTATHADHLFIASQ